MLSLLFLLAAALPVSAEEPDPPPEEQVVAEVIVVTPSKPIDTDRQAWTRISRSSIQSGQRAMSSCVVTVQVRLLLDA